MKKLFIPVIFLIFSQTVFAQQKQAPLQKSLASVDVGVLGAWITYERQLANQLTLNTQLGLEGGFFGGSGDFNYAFTPSLSAEPRFYYNFNRRAEKGKNTLNNGANYLTLTGTYIPGLFTVANDNLEYVSSFNLIPKWGLRRSIGNNFKFDFAIGYGVAFYENETIGQFGLDLKVGYIFHKK